MTHEYHEHEHRVMQPAASLIDSAPDVRASATATDRDVQSGEPLSVGTCATLACLLEVMAPKPGNVYRGADFEDVTFADFVTSAAVVGPLLDGAAERPVGRTILAAVRATSDAVGTNTNLGTILLLAPLATVPRGTSIDAGIADVLVSLSREDARAAYKAIRLARAGGLGSVAEADIANEPQITLVEAMRLAADRDLVARQYANGYGEVRELVVPWLREGVQRGWPLSDVISWTYLQLMSEFPDSLVARKCGDDIARESAQRAAAVLREGVPGDEFYARALADLDFWLRSDGHRRNPGTSADLVCAGLFVALREGIVRRPWKFYA